MLSDAKLDTIRARTEASSPAGTGDDAWDAAMALMGLAPMAPDR